VPPSPPLAALNFAPRSPRLRGFRMAREKAREGSSQRIVGVRGSDMPSINDLLAYLPQAAASCLT
jgi:hypothetical protein